MKTRHADMVLLSVFLIVTLVASVNGTVWNEYLCQASPISCENPKVILQSGTAGTSTIYTNNTSAKTSIAASAWLSGWGERVKITIDHNEIDSDLYDFPVLVYLSNSSGRNNDDVSFVFDELQSDANRKKIAVTRGDGTTQCYVEIERWDASSEQAWLWVEVPFANSTIDTNLYLYYDADHADNTDYVGDTGSTTAENVWDINHVLVWHMSEEGDVLDSTLNDNDGTVTGLTSVVGKIGHAKNSSGGSNGIVSVNNATLGTGQFTVEGWFNPNVYTTEWIGLFGPKDPTIDYNEIMWPYQGKWGYWDWSVVVTSNQPIVAGQWDYYVAVREGTGSNQLKNYVNGLYDNAGTSTRNFPAQPVWLGKSSTYPWNGISDELRISNISRSAAWIKASYESGRDDLLDFGSKVCWLSGWLSGWDNRVKITVDKNDVDSTLSNFPALIYLSNSSGRNNDDVSFVFDELQNDTNRRKIAVTISDGITQCYVEIERWNDANEQGWLWVKVPSISNMSDTNLYLYYDADHIDNTDYVGDPGSISAMNVWDSNFAMVQHLHETSKTGGGYNDHLDSTSKDNDGEAENGVAMDAPGKINGADDFDGTNDYINVSDSNSLDVTGITVSAWVNFTESCNGYIVAKLEDLASASDEVSYFFSVSNVLGDKYLRLYVDTDGSWSADIEQSTETMSGNEWHHVVGTYSSDGTYKLYLDGSLMSSNGGGAQSGNIFQGSGRLLIGARMDTSVGNPQYYFNGTLDEVRISNTARTAAWINASYESGRDNLLDFWSEETNIVDYVDNNTSEMGPPSDKGTHGNFSAQQAGPDLVFDTLTEEKTASESGYRVQQGDFLFQGTDTYIPLDHEVNTTYAFVIMPNLMWQENVTAATSGYPAMNDDNAFVTAYLYNSTHIRVQRWTSSDGDLRIGWQVLECFADEFAVQRGEKYLSSFTSQNASDTISNAVDPTKSMAWHYWRTSYTTRDGRVSQFYSNVTNSTTITFRRQGNQSVTGYLRWIVVEWNTSKIDNFAQGYVTGYGTDASPFIDSIGTTVNESQSILIFQTHAVGDDGLDTSTTAGYFMNNTHVGFYNYDSSFSRGMKWYVIDFGPGVGSRQDNDHTAWSSTDYVNDDSLDPFVQLNRALVWLSGSSNGDGTLKPRHTQWWVLNAINSTHSDSLHYERRYGGQDREVAWQVLELPYSSANHELDLEVQWTNANYTETYEELCIKTGMMGTEGIKVDVWNGSTWITVITNLTPNSWNNVSVSLYLNSSTFTIRFKGGSETGDSTEDSWNIDTTLLHVLTKESTTYNYVLQSVNLAAVLWKVRLRAYNQSNTGRLSNCTIYFHNSTDGFSSQINIENGLYKQDVGPWYDLTSYSIIYISLTVVTKTQGTSYVYTYLEILIPDTSIYTLFVITFEIT